MSKYRLVLALAMVVSLTVLISAGSAEAKKTVKVNGSAQGTDLTSAFSFDGVAPAGSVISTGKDNIGGTFNAQAVGEFSFTADSCTAPDGTAGTALVLVEARAVRTYNKGQMYT